MATTRPVSYLICALPRSGSSVVCDALSATELAGHPREYFQPEAVLKWRETLDLPTGSSPQDYLLALRREKSTPNGVFGAKIMRSHFDAWLSGLNGGGIPASPQAASEQLADLLPGLCFVWMRRRDLVRQGISLLRATQTDLWHTRNSGRQAKMQPHYDFKELDAKVRLLQRQDDEWRVFFAEAGLSPTEIVYEEFDADMAGCIGRTLEALGIEVPAGMELFRRPLALNRQGDALNDEWATRYHEEQLAH